MSTSVSSSATKTNSKQSGGLRKWVIVVGGLFFTLAAIFFVRTQGSVSGREFAPEQFKTRQFHFYEIPLLHMQITPIRRKGVSVKAVDYLRLSGLIKVKSTPPDDEDWDLVELSRGLSGSTPADANLFIEPMESSGAAGTPRWEQWSIDHPKMAAVVWPEIQKLANRELYILVPSILEMLQHDHTPAELSKKIDSLLREEYRTLVVDMRAAGRPEVAKQLLSEALADYPNDDQLKKLSSPAEPATATADETKTDS